MALWPLSEDGESWMLWLLRPCPSQNSQVPSPVPLSFTSWTKRVRVRGPLGRHWDWAGGGNSQGTQLHVSATTAWNPQKEKKDLGEPGGYSGRRKGRRAEEESSGCTADWPPI